MFVYVNCVVFISRPTISNEYKYYNSNNLFYCTRYFKSTTNGDDGAKRTVYIRYIF